VATMRIPDHVVYRIYGDALAIVMNVSTRATALLQHEALALWRGLAREDCDVHSPGSAAVWQHLSELGMIEAQGMPAGAISSAPTTSVATVPAPRVDAGVINYWAFKNRIPISGHFELTDRCNLRCQHCYCLFERTRDTLVTAEVIRIIDELERSGTLGLVLTGGEVFARSDISDILDHLARRRFVLRVNTNGTYLTESRVVELTRYSNIYRVHVSLYGSRAEVHDNMTRSPGSFDKTLRGIRLMHEAGMRLRVNCSVTQANFDDVPGVHDLITQGLGIPVRFDPLIFPRDDGSTSNTSGMLDDAQHGQLVDFVQRRDSSEKPIAQGAAEAAKPKLCKAAFAFFSICEDGRVYPCLKMKRFYATPLGNLREQAFEEIWERSPATRRIRESLDRKLRECHVCDLKV